MIKLYSNKKLLPPLALMCAVLWAMAYPLIKLGYQEMCVASDDLGGKILFGGVRFFFAGLLVLLFNFKSSIKTRITKNAFWWILLFALINTSLHYMFSYIGLGHVQSSRGTILDSTGSFMLIILSCIMFADDKMSIYKVLGCILGFGGIVLINIQPNESLFENISFSGDGMIFLNAVCAAFGGVVSRIVSKKADMTFATGLSMAVGGAIMCAVALIIKPNAAWRMSVKAVLIIIALTAISAVSFTVYNSLLAYHPISTVAIYNAFIPIFGVMFSAVILNEQMSYKYYAAGIMVTVGIALANKKAKGRK